MISVPSLFGTSCIRATADSSLQWTSTQWNLLIILARASNDQQRLWKNFKRDGTKSDICYVCLPLVLKTHPTRDSSSIKREATGPPNLLQYAHGNIWYGQLSCRVPSKRPHEKAKVYFGYLVWITSSEICRWMSLNMNEFVDGLEPKSLPSNMGILYWW